MPTYTPETKNAGSFTAQTKNTGTFSGESFGRTAATLATAGLYYGFGAFTYSGGQQLVSGQLPSFISQTKTP